METLERTEEEKDLGAWLREWQIQCQYASAGQLQQGPKYANATSQAQEKIQGCEWQWLLSLNLSVKKTA